MKARDVKTALVVGAGVMGHSIAQVFATAGIETRLVDLNEDALKRAMDLVENNLETLSEAKRLGKKDIPDVLKRIHPTTDLEAAAKDVDYVLEAVVEVDTVKREVFSRLEAACPKDTVLASNTSGLDVFEIIDIKDPSRLVVAHWFAPPHIIPLVEVVPGEKTAPDAVTLTMELMERLGKKPVFMKKFARSFIVNKIQNNIFLAVMDILTNELASVEDIDAAVKHSLGIRLPIVGVAQSLDFTGLDLVRDSAKSYGMTFPIIEEKVTAGAMGAKTSRGLYDYQGRSEEQILKDRDRLYLKMLDYMEKIGAFKPV
ncbi:MAG: 3-hydroxyacyl-CoA dehydrogenase family protein [Deltaproteobacteria bacterium]|nr:3-hydroxyacyl-CoA dehydrogenase family protein [Candidatus Zymogenaceae bacterium]